MTDKLNPEQRRRVAKGVTGNEHRVGGDAPTGDEEASDYWSPDSKLWQWKSLVRWIADRNLRDGFAEAEALNYNRAIDEDNTDALERMVLEILEAQDD